MNVNIQLSEQEWAYLSFTFHSISVPISNELQLTTKILYWIHPVLPSMIGKEWVKLYLVLHSNISALKYMNNL